jgi:hypothetical protein
MVFNATFNNILLCRSDQLYWWREQENTTSHSLIFRSVETLQGFTYDFLNYLCNLCIYDFLEMKLKQNNIANLLSILTTI